MNWRLWPGLGLALLLARCGGSPSTQDLFGGPTAPGSGGAAEGGATGSGGAPLGSGGFESGSGGIGTGTGGAIAFLDAGSSGGAIGSGGSGGDVSCPVRSFTGTLSCSETNCYASQIGNINVGAKFTFSVTSTGDISGTYTGTSPITSTARLTGTMNCAEHTLMINIVNGAYSGIFAFPGTFTGKMLGDLTPGSESISGTWTITEGNPSYGGNGTWTAQ